MNQPFDDYKNKGVEYDYILSASVKIGIVDNIIPNLINLLKDEDFLKIYFPDIALGRVYGKVEYINEKLQFTFGISLVDAKQRPTSKDLSQNIKDFILSLNKNIETPKLDIKESDIIVDIITENKNYLDNIDKKLVNEGKISFTRLNEVQSFELTSDGIVERYINGNLCNTMPFSKLGVLRECKALVTDGYTLTLNTWQDVKTEAEIKTDKNSIDNDITLDNPEETKKELQQNIKDVEEIQNLKDELEDKLDTLNEDGETAGDYVLVVYTNVNGEFVPDTCVKGIDGQDYIIANSIDEAGKYSKEEADKIVNMFNDPKVNGEKYILKSVKLDDIDTLKGLYENKELKIEDKDLFEEWQYLMSIMPEDVLDDYVGECDLSDGEMAGTERPDDDRLEYLISEASIALTGTVFESKEIKTEDTRATLFPSTKFTAKKLNANELKDFNINRDLTIDQVGWIQANIGNIFEVEDGVRNFVSNMEIFDEEPIISLDDYFNNLKNALKGE